MYSFVSSITCLVVNENYPTDLFFVSALINVSLGGLVTAVAVRLIFPRAPMQQLGLIVAGWIVAAIVTGIGLSQIKDSAVIGAVLVVLGGLIGGGATIWTVEGARGRA